MAQTHSLEECTSMKLHLGSPLTRAQKCIFGWGSHSGSLPEMHCRGVSAVTKPSMLHTLLILTSDLPHLYRFAFPLNCGWCWLLPPDLILYYWLIFLASPQTHLFRLVRVWTHPALVPVTGSALLTSLSCCGTTSC